MGQISVFPKSGFVFVRRALRMISGLYMVGAATASRSDVRKSYFRNMKETILFVCMVCARLVFEVATSLVSIE